MADTLLSLHVHRSAGLSWYSVRVCHVHVTALFVVSRHADNVLTTLLQRYIADAAADPIRGKYLHRYGFLTPTADCSKEW